MKGSATMTASSTKIHENLVALSAILASTKKRISDETPNSIVPEADVIQISKFTASINGICDKLQKISILDEHSDEHKEIVKKIYNDIQCINEIGAELEIVYDIIPMTTDTKDVINTANVIYYNVALPYLLNTCETANIDYARYLIKQGEKHFLARTIQHLNSQIAKDTNYAPYVRAYWRTQTEIIMNYNKTAYLFLKGCEMLAQYEKEIKTCKKAESHNADVLSAVGKIIIVEKHMLKAGHVDEQRQILLDSIFKHAISSNTVSITDEKTYTEVVRKQKQEQPTFTIGDLKSCAGILKTAMNNMNENLRKTGVMPLTTSINALDMLKAGKLICDFTYDIIKNSDTNGHDKYQLAVQRWTKDIIARFKEVVVNIKKTDIIQNQLFENAKACAIDISSYNGNVMHDADCINMRGKLTMLDNTIKTACGYTILPHNPQYMLDVEVHVSIDALNAAMTILKNEGFIQT